MKDFISHWTKWPSTRSFLVWVPLAFALNLWATQWLNESYASSQFPVPYYVAQLSFDAAKLKAWYGQLLALGSLDLYVRTQHIDFAFIASTLVLHFLVFAWIGRSFGAHSRIRRGWVVFALVSAIAPIADACENLVSYFMLADPTGFPDHLALAYSTFASIKFFFFFVAYMAALGGVCVVIWSLLARRRMRATPAGNSPLPRSFVQPLMSPRE
ncbi:hypothetical protein [Piscinibacter sp. HJYY11]|uniref:hypothetical protein n=1 Tax=Piscinibacter sp. HJYY11 TaxID=2801333 RepID=UPI00191FBCAE|nr:hypothetical protein [Piscinibacter sp. HJYY11]MBL0729634.1 hypothetical protein [Piscinibacter sp. HJYY11]